MDSRPDTSETWHPTVGPSDALWTTTPWSQGPWELRLNSASNAVNVWKPQLVDVSQQDSDSAVIDASLLDDSPYVEVPVADEVVPDCVSYSPGGVCFDLEFFPDIMPPQFTLQLWGWSLSMTVKSMVPCDGVAPSCKPKVTFEHAGSGQTVTLWLDLWGGCGIPVKLGDQITFSVHFWQPWWTDTLIEILDQEGHQILMLYEGDFEQSPWSLATESACPPVVGQCGEFISPVADSILGTDIEANKGEIVDIVMSGETHKFLLAESKLYISMNCFDWPESWTSGVVVTSKGCSANGSE